MNHFPLVTAQLLHVVHAHVLGTDALLTLALWDYQTFMLFTYRLIMHVLKQWVIIRSHLCTTSGWVLAIATHGHVHIIMLCCHSIVCTCSTMESCMQCWLMYQAVMGHITNSNQSFKKFGVCFHNLNRPIRVLGDSHVGRCFVTLEDIIALDYVTQPNTLHGKHLVFF